jgi:hypothetical protein
MLTIAIWTCPNSAIIHSSLKSTQRVLDRQHEETQALFAQISENRKQTEEYEMQWLRDKIEYV